MEPYLSLTNFHHRHAICEIHISAHKRMIEFGRYHKPKPIPREERLCQNCCLNDVENEIHFLTRCSNYETERTELFKDIYSNYSNFVLLNDTNKALWLLSHEREDFLIELAIYIVKCQDKKNRNHASNSNKK